MAEPSSLASNLAFRPKIITDSRTSEQTPLFPPRPIILRYLQESRNPDRSEKHIDPSKIIITLISPPQHIEVLIRRNYIKIWKEFMAAGYSPDPDPTINLKKWLICSIRQLSTVGLRVVQGTSGQFLFGDEEKYAHITFLPFVVNDLYSRWSFQGRRRQRSRSESPVRSARTDRVKAGRVSKERSMSRENKRGRALLTTGTCIVPAHRSEP
ncbi:hypothetical protein BU23DRAFT_562822 [Bimuria novae-zelandiae CBS 107.79]|uniref:Uncharacterized protein n=1 Tax=Bimuria novae-zelandiae CBS 107.79 TaxID=1447943 RepID=A0A6A5VUA2_9PLEO|nr:hypothetical protein BU23DRAFT_562822 [Bimuria novae-zelandiae CBS 107.79]